MSAVANFEKLANDSTIPFESLVPTPCNIAPPKAVLKTYEPPKTNHPASEPRPLPKPMS